MFLKAKAIPNKYGIIRVKNPDGTFNREIRLTSAEVSALQAAGRFTDATHIGVTKTEWEAGLAKLTGFACEVGDMLSKPDGQLWIKYAEKLVLGETVDSWLFLKPGEFSGIPPLVTIDQAVLNVLPGKPILSCVNGVLETLEKVV